MANTYTQLHIHVVISVRNRDHVIQQEWKDELYKYLTGIVHQKSHRLLAIGGMPDHVHILLGLRPTQALSELMQVLKVSSSKWINEKHFTRSRFYWQEGFGAFAISKSAVPKVINYINNQFEHHKTKSFLEEYINLLNAEGIAFEKRFLFSEVEYDEPIS